MTTPNVTIAPTDRSSDPTSSAWVWPIATTASGSGQEQDARDVRRVDEPGEPRGRVARGPHRSAGAGAPPASRAGTGRSCATCSCRARRAGPCGPRGLAASVRSVTPCPGATPPSAWPRPSGDRPARDMPGSADDRLDDAELVQLVARDLLDDLPPRHHEHPVAEPGELERVARLHEQGRPARRSASAAPRRCRSAIPTSTPCVGSYARITVGSRRNVRATATFCWLPPERNSTGCSSEGVRISSRSTSSSDGLALLAPAQEAEHAEPAQRLDRGVDPDAEHRHQRLVLAVARQQHDPRPHGLVRRDQHQLLAVARRPGPLCGGCRPARQSNSCGCPLPSAPAMPTISPRVSVKLTGPNDWPCRPSTTSASPRSSARRRGRGERGLERRGRRSGRPTRARRSSAASNVPWLRPSRSTVMRSAISSTSGSRWLT